VRKADNLPPSSVVVTKSGNLNFVEPPGPVQACNGTALPLPYHVASDWSFEMDESTWRARKIMHINNLIHC
jgi:hypothetical protein